MLRLVGEQARSLAGLLDATGLVEFRNSRRESGRRVVDAVVCVLAISLF